MPLSLNSSLDGLRLSGIRHFSTLAAQTPGCVSLTLGEPGEDTTPNVCAKVGEDLARGLTHYPPNNGYAWLREAICAWEAERGVRLAPENVIVTDGATEALFCAITSLLNPGDEVIIPTPAFLLYDSLVRLARGRASRGQRRMPGRPAATRDRCRYRERWQQAAPRAPCPRHPRAGAGPR